MRTSRRAILFFNWFSAGLFTPVLGLLLLERGCTLETLPLVAAIHAAVAIAAEMPSGVFADLCGRKRTFLISCALYGTSMVWILCSRSFWALFAGFAIHGLGRAFASGSLDPLFVEECLREKGEASLATVTGQLSLWQTLGLTAGAVVGGALPNWHGYALHILLRLVLLAFTAVLCALLVGEGRGPEQEERVTLRSYLSQGWETARGNRVLAGLLLGFLASGAVLSLIEIYWQPAFAAMATASERPFMGVVSAAGFLAATLGNLAVRRVSGGERRGYLLLRLLLTGLVGLLALQDGVPGFMAAYVGVYLVIGGGDVMEQTLLNRAVSDGQRAGFLSVTSLVAQLGGLAAGGISSVLVGHAGISGLFLVGGAAVLAAALGAAALGRRRAEEPAPL